MFGKERSEDTGEFEQALRGFEMVRRLFGVSETAGDDLSKYEPVECDASRALGALAISRQTFELPEGTTQPAG